MKKVSGSDHQYLKRPAKSPGSDRDVKGQKLLIIALVRSPKIWVVFSVFCFVFLGELNSFMGERVKNVKNTFKKNKNVSRKAMN